MICYDHTYSNGSSLVPTGRVVMDTSLLVGVVSELLGDRLISKLLEACQCLMMYVYLMAS